jgi:L-threonylcarbamoyladenylate synthase
VDPVSERSLLFVCTGNTCRSPLAEYLFRARMPPGSGWLAASAGTAAAVGAPASPGTIAALGEAGIDATPHRSRPLTADAVDRARWIVVMTGAHAADVTARFPRAAPRVRLLTSFGSDTAHPDVPDPIGGSKEVYRACRDRIERAVLDIVLHLWDGADGAVPGARPSEGGA